MSSVRASSTSGRTRPTAAAPPSSNLRCRNLCGGRSGHVTHGPCCHGSSRAQRLQPPWPPSSMSRRACGTGWPRAHVPSQARLRREVAKGPVPAFDLREAGGGREGAAPAPVLVLGDGQHLPCRLLQVGEAVGEGVVVVAVQGGGGPPGSAAAASAQASGTAAAAAAAAAQAHIAAAVVRVVVAVLVSAPALPGGVAAAAVGRWHLAGKAGMNGCQGLRQIHSW